MSTIKLRRTKPLIAYASSLIQQNHGEKLDGHGFLIWDVQNISCEFIKAKNVYGFVTLHVKDGNVIDLPTKLPENIRLRVIVENTDDVVIKEIIADIRKNHTLIECVVNKKHNLLSASVNSSEVLISDIGDINNQNRILSDYLFTRFANMSPTMVKQVLEINKEINSNVSIEDLPKNLVWKPIRMTFDNMFTYGKNNEITFDGMNGVVGLFGQNASGKSSVFENLSFVLFDKTPRAAKGAQFINSRENECYCELEFEVNGERYIINRTGKRKKEGDVKIDVDFYRIESNGDKTSLNGAERRYTNKIIRQYVGDYEDFILTAFSVQGNNSLFIDKGQAERKETLSQFMGLVLFDRLYDVANKKLNGLLAKIEQYKEIDFSTKIAETQANIDSITMDYEISSSSIVSAQSDIAKIDATIQAETDSKTPINVKVTNIVDLMKLQESIPKEIFRLIDSVQQVNIEKENTEKLLSEMVIVDIAELEESHRAKTFAEMDLKKVSGEMGIVLSELNNMTQKLERLKNHKYNPNCEYCINNEFVKDAIQTKNLIGAQEEKYSNLLIKTNLLKNNIDTEFPIDTESKLRMARQNMAAESKYTRNISEFIKKKEVAIAQMEALDSKLKIVNNSIDEYNQNLESIEANKKIELRIKSLFSDKTIMQQNLRQLEQKNKQVYGQKMVVEERLNTLVRDHELYNSMLADMEAYTVYVKAMHRDGIPYHLMKEVLPVIQGEVNSILSQMVDFTIELDMNDSNINGYIVYDETRKWALELASGMEKFVSSLAIRVALMQISNLPRSTFLVLDEGLGTLDSDNLNSIHALFDYLKTQFEFVVLISHVDTARDIADHIIEITRTDGYSKITA